MIPSLMIVVLIIIIAAIGRIGKPKIDLLRLIDAISIAETSNDDSTIGDGDAVGRFQLRKKYVDDVNQILSKANAEELFTYDDRLDYEKSRLMIGIYWSEYAKQPFCGFLHIEDLVVDKDHQNQGIATDLIKFCFDKIKSVNYYKIILDCNKEIIPFYEKFGFVERNVQMAKYI